MKTTEKTEALAPWIEERGPRHGNNRKLYARLKKKQRKTDRAKLKQEGYDGH